MIRTSIRSLLETLHERQLSLVPALMLTMILMLTSCAAEKATVLLVHVTRLPGVSDPFSLAVTFSHMGKPYINKFTNSGLAIGLPTHFVIRADGRSGAAQISVQAKDKDDRLLGIGSTTASIVPDEQVAVTVQLEPADFQVNDRYILDQTFSYGGPTGRQVASGMDGEVPIFVAVWVDETCPKACDVWYRLFDGEGRARTNGVTNKTEEYQANEGIANYDMPAVAMRADDGHFVITWQRQDPQLSPPEKITSRAFYANGRPDDQSNGGKENTLSATDAIYPASPDIAALTDRNYIVVWEQESQDGRWQVMGRFLGPHGVPTKPISNPNEPFEVASFPFNASSPPQPAVAHGMNQGFMVLWMQNSKLAARAYAKQAAPLIPAFSLPSSGNVQSFNIGSLANGYGILWSDTASCGADQEGTCLRFQRYDLKGSPMEEAYTLNTSPEGNQSDPTMARRKDDSMLVAWSSSTGVDDDQGGIRGRILLSNGLPVGDDFQINTTTAQAQTQPSAAPLTEDSFIVVFRDSSATGPDTLGAGIRGRILYPQFQVQNGKIGALCSPNGSCEAGLSCQQTQTGIRCVATCPGPGASCPHGGKCQPLSVGGNVCLYP